MQKKEKSFPVEIETFLQEEWIANFAFIDNEKTWAFNAYYVYLQNPIGILFASTDNSHHAKIICNDSHCSLTIHNSSRNINLIQGVQATGRVTRLDCNSTEWKNMFSIYIKKFPDADTFIKSFPLWRVDFDYVKFTNNEKKMGYKIAWKI